MPWTRPTLQQIVQRIENDITSRLTGGVALLRVAVLRILARVFGGAFDLLHGYLQYLSFQPFATTADEEFLQRIADDYEVPRNAATFAGGNIDVNGDNGTFIATGTIFLSDAGLEYATTADGTIAGGQAVIPAVCNTSGAAGNLDVGALMTSQSVIIGVSSSVVDVGGMTGGADVEPLEDWRARVLFRIRNQPAGGSETDYTNWARSVDGVDNAWVFANTPDPGSVTVVISAVGTNPEPGAPLIAAVQAYIDTLRPVTAFVIVAGVNAVQVDIDVEITPFTQPLQDAVEANLRALFTSEAAPAGTLYISHLTDAIHTAGLLDHDITDLEVDDVNISTTANHVFPSYDFPVLREVNLSAL